MVSGLIVLFDISMLTELSLFTGVITGTGNIFPKLMVKLYETSVEAIKTGDLQKWAEAQRLQLIGEFGFIPFRNL